MKIIIDGDACPSIPKIELLAQQYSIPTDIYCDFTHTISSDYASVYQVDSGYQNVDMIIANKIEKQDILITQDYGLAMIALTRGASVIEPKGMVYTVDTIDSLLTQRHNSSKMRASGKHVKGPRKRTIEDEENLLNNLEKMILLWYNMERK